MKKRGGHLSHGILMLLCCLGPIVLLAVLSSLKWQSSGVKNILTVLIFLACPLGHLVMMKFMPHNHKHQDLEDKKILKEEINY